MVNKKIKVIAKIERDAQNFFFVKMYYGFMDSEIIHYKERTVYEIEDKEFIDNLIALSYAALSRFRCGRNIGSTIVVYNTKTRVRSNGPYANYTDPDQIIVGTVPMINFEEINYLVHMMSFVMEKEKLGEFFVQYKDKVMREDEFYEFQNKLSIHMV